MQIALPSAEVYMIQAVLVCAAMTIVVVGKSVDVASKFRGVKTPSDVLKVLIS